MTRKMGFVLWICGIVIMFPLWMDGDKSALICFVVALVGGAIVGCTERNA